MFSKELNTDIYGFGVKHVYCLKRYSEILFFRVDTTSYLFVIFHFGIRMRVDFILDANGVRLGRHVVAIGTSGTRSIVNLV